MRVKNIFFQRHDIFLLKRENRRTFIANVDNKFAHTHSDGGGDLKREREEKNMSQVACLGMKLFGARRSKSRRGGSRYRTAAANYSLRQIDPHSRGYTQCAKTLKLFPSIIYKSLLRRALKSLCAFERLTGK